MWNRIVKEWPHQGIHEYDLFITVINSNSAPDINGKRKEW